jgi:hypothetical protein
MLQVEAGDCEPRERRDVGALLLAGNLQAPPGVLGGEWHTLEVHV